MDNTRTEENGSQAAAAPAEPPRAIAGGIQGRRSYSESLARGAARSVKVTSARDRPLRPVFVRAVRGADIFVAWGCFLALGVVSPWRWAGARLPRGAIFGCMRAQLDLALRAAGPGDEGLRKWLVRRQGGVGRALL